MDFLEKDGGEFRHVNELRILYHLYITNLHTEHIKVKKKKTELKSNNNTYLPIIQYQ